MEPACPELSTTLDAMSRALVAERRDGRETWILRRALTEAERSTLSSDCKAMEYQLRCTDAAVSFEYVAMMFKAFPAREKTEEEHATDDYLYADAVRDIPVWCVASVCRAFRNGAVPGQNKRWRPTPAELSGACREFMAPYYRQMHEVREILRAEVPRVTDDAERKRNCERVKALLSTFSAPGTVIK